MWCTYTRFWDRHVLLFVDFLDKSKCETSNILRRTIKNNKAYLVFFLYIHVHPGVAYRTQDLIASYGWKQFHYHPYNLDLVPSGCHSFLQLKNLLNGQRYDTMMTSKWQCCSSLQIRQKTSIKMECRSLSVYLLKKRPS